MSPSSTATAALNSVTVHSIRRARGRPATATAVIANDRRLPYVRGMRLFVFLAAFILASPAAAQGTGGTLLDRLTSVAPGSTTGADCDRQVEQAASLNGPDLLYGSVICAAASRLVESSFLLSAGQVRSMVDLALLVPESRADSEVGAGLYGVLYFHAGGPGADTVLRESTLRARFLELLDTWSPRFDADYGPGWNLRRRPEPAAYQAAISEAKADRRAQLVDIARLYSDEKYYALHRRFMELQARTGGRYVDGTTDANLSQELSRQMHERSVALGIGPELPNPDEADLSIVRTPPAGPAPDEEALSNISDPVTQRCADMAERMTIATDSRLLRVLITRSPEWGIVWRADLAGGDQPVLRFTCTERSTSSVPLDMGEESIPPLPAPAEPSNQPA